MEVELSFSMFLAIFIFLHIFVVYGPIFKIFAVKNIKINFPVVSKKHPWWLECLSAGFWLSFIFTYFLIPLMFLVRCSNFLRWQYHKKFSYCSEHPVCILLWPLVCQSSYKITYSHPRILCFATYGCCHPCLFNNIKFTECPLNPLSVLLSLIFYALLLIDVVILGF